MAPTDEQVLESLEGLRRQAEADALQLAASYAMFRGMVGTKVLSNIAKGLEGLVHGAQADAAMAGLATDAWRAGNREEAVMLLTPPEERH